MYKQTAALLGVFFITLATADAAVIVRTADQLEVAEGVIDDGELLAIGLPVVLSNEVVEDVTLIGNQVKVNAPVGGDVLAAGFFVDIDSPVNDDVRVVGGEVTIASDIAGDLVVLGGAVELLSTASVAGDVVVYGGSADLAGSVGGDVVGAAEFLTIKGDVGGGIDVRVVELTLGDTASITESVRYVSGNLVNQALNATVGGDVVRSDPVMQVTDSSLWIQMLQTLLVVLFTALVWYLLSRKTLSIVAQSVAARPLRVAAIGASFVFLSPLVIVILFISQLGVFVAGIYLFAFIAILLLAMAAMSPIIGRFALQLFNQPAAVSPVGIVIGAVCVTGCMVTPIVGFAVLGIVAILAAGGIIETAIQANQ